jgi:hypothetical protein
MFVPNWDQVSLLTNLKKLWYKIKMCMCWKVQNGISLNHWTECWWFWEFILVFSNVLFSARLTYSFRLLPTMLFCLLISVTVVNFVVLHHLLSKKQHSHAAWWPCAVIYPRLVLLIYHFWCPVVQTLVSMIRHGWIELSMFDFSHDCSLNFLLSTFFSYVFPQLLENHIKKELTENSQLVQSLVFRFFECLNLVLYIFCFS